MRATTFKFVLLFCCSFLFFQKSNAEVLYASPLSVNGEEFEIGNLLEWSTSYETESAFFYVEKSLDGVTYENVGTVEAAGNSNDEQKYRYMDIQVTDMEAHYRLRQVDEDGTESLSHAVQVIKEMKNQFMIIDFSSITVDKMFNVTIDALTEGQMSYSLYSYKGETVFKSSKQLINGINSFEINMADEKEGKYKLVFELGDEVETLNIIKLEDEMKKKPNVASKRSTTGG